MADETELAQLREAVKAAQNFFDRVMPKMNVGASVLGAEEIQIWNDAEIQIKNAGSRMYLVTLDRTDVYEVQVRASSGAEATQKARKLLDGAEDPSVYLLDYAEYQPVEALPLPIVKSVRRESDIDLSKET